MSELKIDFGPGYRVYYTQQGNRLLLLLAGGDKSSQSKEMAAYLDAWLEEAPDDAAGIAREPSGSLLAQRE